MLRKSLLSSILLLALVAGSARAEVLNYSWPAGFQADWSQSQGTWSQGDGQWSYMYAAKADKDGDYPLMEKGGSGGYTYFGADGTNVHCIYPWQPTLRFKTDNDTRDVILAWQAPQDMVDVDVTSTAIARFGTVDFAIAHGSSDLLTASLPKDASQAMNLVDISMSAGEYLFFRVGGGYKRADWDVSIAATVVPEPATMLLLAVGACLALARKRRMR